MKQSGTKILFLCFHYLKKEGQFRRIWGYDFEMFQKNIDFLMKEFPPISFRQFNDFLVNQGSLPPACSVLSFDDGLKEHSAVIAPFLAKKGIKAVFSAPTCILRGEMAPPQVIHFTVAKYGARNFYQSIKEHFAVTNLNFFDYFDPAWQELEILEFYGRIKNTLLYRLPYQATAKLLRAVFLNVLQRDYPGILEEVYLNEWDLKNLAEEGHEIACHTHSHFSFINAELKEAEWQKELVEPKRLLGEITGKDIDIFTYPYGSSRDKFDFELWREKLKNAGFRYGANAFRDLQGKGAFDPFWLERYSVQRNDTPYEIQKNSFYYYL